MDRQPSACAAAARPDWNVVVTLPERTFREASRLLRRWGTAQRTGFHNVLAMTVEDPRRCLGEFAAALAEAPGLRNFVSHAVPAERAFDFGDPAEFAARARSTSARSWRRGSPAAIRWSRWASRPAGWSWRRRSEQR